MTVNLFRGSSPFDFQVLSLRHRGLSQVPLSHQVRLCCGRDSPSVGSPAQPRGQNSLKPVINTHTHTNSNISIKQEAEIWRPSFSSLCSYPLSLPTPSLPHLSTVRFGCLVWPQQRYHLTAPLKGADVRIRCVTQQEPHSAWVSRPEKRKEPDL